MATVVWTGNAAPRAQVTQIEFPGKVRVGEKFSVTCNSKTLTYTATTDRMPDVASGLAALIGQFSNDLPEFAELSAEADGDRVVITGPEDGKPFTVTAIRGEVATVAIQVQQVQQGYAGKSEIQRIQIVGTATSGNFTLSFRGQTTSNIAYNANAATVQSALEGLSTIGSGNVTVSGSNPWDVTWAAGFKYDSPDLITANGGGLSKSGSYTVTVSTSVGAKPGKNKILRIIDGSGGNASSTIAVRSPTGTTIGTWAGDATAATVQGHFDTYFGANNSIVRRPQLGVWDVEFVGAYANVNAPVIGTTVYGVGGTSIVCSTQITQETAGSETINSQWRLTPPAYGTYQLTWTDPRTGNQYGSATIPYSATAAEIEAAIADVYAAGTAPSVAAVVSEDGDRLSTSGPFLITFLGPLAGNDVSEVTVTAGTVEQTQTGEFSVTAEVQSLRIRPYAASGAFKLTFRGNQTGALGPTDAVATIQAAIDSAWGSGAATVSEGNSVYGKERQLKFTFSGLTGRKEPITVQVTTTLTSPFIGLETIQEPTAPTCEEQVVALGNAPGGGTFTLDYNGSTSGTIAYNAAPSVVEKTLAALISSETNPVTVSGPEGGPWRVKFGGTMAGRNALALSGSGASLSGSKVAVSRTQQAESPENERQRVALRGSPSGGTFTLTFDSQTTGSLPYNASPEVVQAALEALSSVGYGNVLVTSTAPGGPYLVEFGGSLAAANQSAITATSSLTGSGTSGNVATTTDPTGPNWFSEPLNYAGGAVPTNSDVLVFEHSDVPVLYGLEDLAAVTLAELHVRQSFTASSIGLPTSTGEYREYRPLALKIKATKVYVGQGDGTGCPLVRLNTGTAQTEVLVQGTGQPSTELPALNWIGDHGSNAVKVFRGSVGLSSVAGQTGQLAALALGYVDSVESDVNVVVGAGLGTIGTVDQIGGVLSCAANVTTGNFLAGECELIGAATVATMHVGAAAVYYSSTGTCSQAYVMRDGLLSFTRNMQQRTFTNCTIVSGAAIHDPAKTVIWTNPIALSHCRIQDVDLQLGTNITIDVA